MKMIKIKNWLESSQFLDDEINLLVRLSQIFCMTWIAIYHVHIFMNNIEIEIWPWFRGIHISYLKLMFQFIFNQSINK